MAVTNPLDVVGKAVAAVARETASVVAGLGKLVVGMGQVATGATGAGASLAGFAARVGAAAAGLAGRPLQQIQSFFASLSSQVAGLVAKFQAAPAQRFQLALDGLAAAIGSTLVPTLDRFTAFAQLLNRHITGLTAEGRQLVAGLTTGAVAMTAFAGAAALVQTVLTGGLMPVLGAVVGALGGVAVAGGGLDGFMTRFSAVFAGLADAVGAALARVEASGAMEAFLAALVEVGGVLVNVAASLFEFVAPALTVVAELVRVLAPMIPVLAAGFVVLNPGLLLVSSAVAVLGTVLEAAGPYILGAGRAIKTFFDVVVQSIREFLAYIGVVGPSLTTAPTAAPAAVGTAPARSTSTSDPTAVLQRAREAAFGAGTSPAATAAVRTASGIATLNETAARIETAITNFASGFAESVRGVLVSALPSWMRPGDSAGRTPRPAGGFGVWDADRPPPVWPPPASPADAAGESARLAAAMFAPMAPPRP